MHIISSVMKPRGPDVLSQEEKPEKVFKQKYKAMKMGDSQFYTDCKVLPLTFPLNINFSVCLRTFFDINFN